MHLSYVFLILSGWCLGVWGMCIICFVHKYTSMAEFAIFLCFLLYWFLGNGANGVKMALYCPQGSGTLRQQLLSVHGIVCYCIVLRGIEWYCMVLHVIAWYCMVLHGITWYFMVLPEYARVCQSMLEYA